MKKNDVLIILAITVTVGLITYFAANYYFSTAQSQSVKITSVEAVKTDIEKPNSEYFNKEAVNPAVEVYIQNNNEKTQQGI